MAIKSDFGDEFAVVLGRVSRQWRTRLDERLKGNGLTQARWIVLLMLSRSGPISQRDLAKSISVEGPTLVRVLDKLEKQGLVTRLACDDDRRVKQIHLTAAAKPMLGKITRIAIELRNELLANVAGADLEAALRVLNAINDQLERP